MEIFSAGRVPSLQVYRVTNGRFRARSSDVTLRGKRDVENRHRAGRCSVEHTIGRA